MNSSERMLVWLAIGYFILGPLLFCALLGLNAFHEWMYR